jgi:hypothetical protein
LKNLRIILSGILALVVLSSAISHSVSFHICAGEIQNITVFGKAQSCKDHDNACDHGERTKQASLNHKGCCEDATLLIDSDKYKTAERITVESPQFIYLPEVSLVLEVNPYKSQFSQLSNYKPPLIERDITILVQTFLI